MTVSKPTLFFRLRKWAPDDIRLFFASVNGNFFNSRSNVQSQPTHLRPLMQTTFLTLSEGHQHFCLQSIFGSMRFFC